MPKGFASNKRITFVAVCIFALFCAVPVRLVQLHVTQRDQRVADASKARRKFDVEHSRRGDIVDKHGDILATSRFLVQVAVDPVEYEKTYNRFAESKKAAALIAGENEKWARLADLVGVPHAEVTRICNNKIFLRTETTKDGTRDVYGSFSWINRDGVPEDVYKKIADLNIKSGLVLKRVYERTYPHNQLAAHILGFVNKEQTAVIGSEKAFNCYLKGFNGWRESEKDVRSRELVQFRSREVPAVDGYTVKLTIDSVIQKWAEEELADLAAKFSPQHATIIISDAQTGALLALANHPTYNPNDYGKAPEEAFDNFAIQSYIDPGSTFKIVVASAALNEGLVTPDTRFDCSRDVAEYKGRTLRLMADDHRWDHPLTVSEIISHSSNRGSALLAMRLGDQRFYDYIRAFGFGSHTGLALGGEVFGSISHVKNWNAIDITRIPAGYSIGATPLQIHYAMAAIANDGELVTPQLLAEVRKPDGELALQFGRQTRRRVITRETARTMRSLLQRVVSSDGTAGRIAIPGYQFAGKTGTAQRFIREFAPGDTERKKPIRVYYSKTNHVGSFSGFFPASAPRVVITVIVDDARPPNGRTAYGSTVAAPSFRHLAEKLIPYLNIKPVPEARPSHLGSQTVIATNH
ncbi:cell division protein FtsI (penicillin-binding protein 3) [Ereboglobus sp. PH5-10]|uniref:peptidoglycan D,D-transpeptidase FtsI family protein n=1 Tax=Ereboglobus sp. PH5-10 TaxID=2940629 RepID=UPI0024073B0D|nr:penicillin-binding protein 2 [Ereboglobus sp. PH5-10]MDF9825999.1 cell division protein FtsI (penicillin-binding protein 3) [Ereboglobus sp. PH5-10]